MASEGSKFHFSYIRDFDRFKATFNEKGWSKKTKKCEKKEPGIPSYYVVHRYEYKGEDGHTKGRLLVSDLAPAEYERREQERKIQIQRWKKKQQHQHRTKQIENDSNGEVESNRNENVKPIKFNNRKKLVTKVNMKRSVDTNTSEEEIKDKVRKCVKGIIKRSIIALNKNKGEYGHRPKMVDPITNGKVHELSTELSQKEKEKVGDTQGMCDRTERETERDKCQENRELREKVRKYVNDIIFSAICSLKGNQHQHLTRQNGNDSNGEIESYRHENVKPVIFNNRIKLVTKVNMTRSVDTNTSEEEIKGKVRKCVEGIIESSIISLNQNKEENGHRPKMVDSITNGKVHQLSTELLQKEKEKVGDIQGKCDRTERETERDKCQENRELRKKVRKYVNDIIFSAICSLKGNQHQRLARQNGNDSNGEIESNRHENVKPIKFNNRNELVTKVNMTRSVDTNTSEEEIKGKVRKYVEGIIECSTISLNQNKEENEHRSEVVDPITNGKVHELSTELPQKEKEKVGDIQGMCDRTERETERDKCQENRELREKVRKYVNGIIFSAICSLKENNQKSMQLTVCQSEKRVCGQFSKQREEDEEINDGKSSPEYKKQEDEVDKHKIEASDRELRDRTREYVEDIIFKSIESLKYNQQDVEYPKLLVVPSKIYTSRDDTEKKKTMDIPGPLYYTNQESMNTRDAVIMPEQEMKETARKYVEEIIQNSLVLFRYMEQEKAEHSNRQVSISQSMVPGHQERTKIGDIQNTFECTELVNCEVNITKQDLRRLTRGYIDEVIPNSLKCIQEDVGTTLPVFIFQQRTQAAFPERGNKDEMKTDSLLDLQQCNAREDEHSFSYIRSVQTNMQEILSKTGNDVKNPSPLECNDSNAKLLHLVIRETTTVLVGLPSGLSVMQAYTKEMHLQFDEGMDRGISANYNVTMETEMDTATSNDNVSVTDGSIMEEICSENKISKEKKGSKMRRMLRRVRKGIRRYFCCCVNK